MGSKMTRRDFLRMGTAATAGLALTPGGVGQAPSGVEKPVRIGIVGVGGRGRGLLQILLDMKGVEVPAVCDTNTGHVKMAQDAVVKAGRQRPEGYSRDEEAFKSLMDRDDLDTVLIATPWSWHAPMAVYGMKAGKYVAVEVPAAITMEQCWDLVTTHEKTGIPCMMLENWSFRRDNLAVLNMIRKGLFGEMVHCHCAYSHDCIDIWFFDREGNPRWPGRHPIERNTAQYPTHALGPVISWMDINCGDYFAYVTSTATKSLGINRHFARKFGADHPAAKRRYAQGDIVTSVIKTHRGKTIVVNNDMQLPRPYDNRWMVQGTSGIYNEQRNAVYLVERSPKHHEWEAFGPYQKEFEHSWWKNLETEAGNVSHGGTDHVELEQFVKAVRNRTQTPIDVYDSVIMSVLIPLAEESIARGSTPVECPDFTRGRWKTRRAAFALNA